MLENFRFSKTPSRSAIIVDNFYADPDAVRRFALAQHFQANPSDHKGERTRLTVRPPEIRHELERYIGAKITNWEQYAYNGVFQFCKAGDTIVYHSDRQHWAAVVYLTPDAPPEAGSILVRSKETKGRTVEESIKLVGHIPRSVAEQQMYAGKLLDPNAWEVVDVIGNVYNRLAIWDGRLAHAARSYFGDRKENARLFHMFFFDSEE